MMNHDDTKVLPEDLIKLASLPHPKPPNLRHPPTAFVDGEAKKM